MFTFAVPVRRALCAAVLMIAAAPPTAEAIQPQPCPGAADIPIDEQATLTAQTAIVCLVNRERTSRGLNALQPEPALAAAARRHAADMARRDYFSHLTPAGRSAGDRIVDAGYADRTQPWKVGEALGWGTGRKARPVWIVQAWLNSPPHRRVLLSPEYVELGVGVVTGAPKPTLLPGATYTMDLGVIR